MVPGTLADIWGGPFPFTLFMFVWLTLRRTATSERGFPMAVYAFSAFFSTGDFFSHVRSASFSLTLHLIRNGPCDCRSDAHHICRFISITDDYSRLDRIQTAMEMDRVGRHVRQRDALDLDGSLWSSGDTRFSFWLK